VHFIDCDEHVLNCHVAKVESDAARYAVQLRAERLSLKVGLSHKVEPPLDLIPGQVLDSYARDLPELLRQLGVKLPKGREERQSISRWSMNCCS
jgi:hypothetical protein